MRAAIRRGAVTTGFVTTLLLSALSPALADGTNLIDASPATVSIDAPAPGETRAWTMSVTNATDRDLPLGLEVTGTSERLFSGSTPLQLTLETSDGRTVVRTVAVGDVLGKSISLPPMTPRESQSYVGTVTLPSSAGNYYQGASGSLRLSFVSEDATPVSGPAIPLHHQPLPDTGASALTTVLAGVGLLAIAVGGLLVRRRKDTHA